MDGANQPLAGVALTLNRNGQDATKEPVISDAQGRFAFSGLPAGDYHLWAEDSGFGSVPYGEAAESHNGSPIRLGGENGVKSVVFRIEPRGLVEGVIRDEFGDPMAGNVFLVRPGWRDGRTTVVLGAPKAADDRGRYHFGLVAPGTYTVCALGGGSQQSPAPVAGPVDFATRVDRYYSRTCSRPFRLAPGQHVQIDVNPAAVAMATVRGHIRNVPAQSGVTVNLLPQDPGQQFNYPTAVSNGGDQGAFTIRGVPPGRYILRAQAFSRGPGQNPLSAEVPVEVGGSDIDGLDVDLGAQATVDVAVHGAEDTRSLNVILRPAGGGNLIYGGLKDSAFQFQSVSPGSYRLIVRTADESCVQSVKLGDAEFRGDTFSVAGGAALHFDVALGQTCGAVRVRAVRDGQAIPGAKVVLLTSGTPDEPGDLTEEFADDEGGFTFTGLRPGHYLVWAWAVQGTGAMSGPDSLAAVAQKATAVDITAGDPVSVDVPLLAAEGGQ